MIYNIYIRLYIITCTNDRNFIDLTIRAEREPARAALAVRAMVSPPLASPSPSSKKMST